MEARDARVADPLDTVHREMDSVFGSHRLTMYANLWSPVIEQLVLEKESAGQSTR